MYQPELGRFLQPDSKEFAAGDYNLYRYCHNDPVNKNDPTGLRSEMAEEIMRDRQWDFACRGDSGNSFQGDTNEYLNRGHDQHAMGEDESGRNRKSEGATGSDGRAPESTSRAISTNPVEVGHGWERTSEGPWRSIGAHYGQITGKGGTGRLLAKGLGLLGVPFRPIPTIHFVREIYYDYERTITERAYIDYRAFTVRTTEHVDSVGTKWNEVRSGNEQWRQYTGETRTMEEIRSDFMGRTP
jgi:hypothetical protein